MKESRNREDPIRIYHIGGDCIIYTIIIIDFYIGNDSYSIYIKLVFDRLRKRDLAKLPVSNINTLIDRNNILVAEAELLRQGKLSNISLANCLRRPISNQVVYSKLVLEILRYIETAPSYYESRVSKIIDFISGETIKVGDEFIKYKALPF